jgi:hypothetical protein
MVVAALVTWTKISKGLSFDDIEEDIGFVDTLDGISEETALLKGNVMDSRIRLSPLPADRGI